MANGGHIAFVSGANCGIGAEVARQLAARGMAVVLGARNLESAEETKLAVEREGGEALIVRLDVTNPGTIAKALQAVSITYGELHVLVNNAGIDYDIDQPAAAADLDRVRSILNVNLLGTWSLSQAMIPMLRETIGARAIVNVSSGAGRLATRGRNSPGYAVSKAALNALTRILAEELDSDGIRVNAVCAGCVATDMAGNDGRPICDRAADVVWAAKLDVDGPTGGCFQDRQLTDW